MRSYRTTERLRHGDYMAEVEVEMHEHEGKDWSPTLPITEVRKLERVRKALERGDIASAAKDARIFRVTPVTAA